MPERSYRLKSQQNEGGVSDIYGLAWKLAACYILSGEFWSTATHEILPMFNIRVFQVRRQLLLQLPSFLVLGRNFSTDQP
jgi:hypothetical protein